MLHPKANFLLSLALMPILHEVAAEWTQYLEREDNLDSVDMKHKFMLAMAEYMARIGMGIKPNILSDQAPEENTYWRRLVIMTNSVTFGAVLDGTQALLFSAS